jgi:hypothetical protein
MGKYRNARRKRVLNKVLHLKINVGLEAIERGQFIEIDEVNLEGYLEGLRGTPAKITR